MLRPKLGVLLVHGHLVTEEQLSAALSIQKKEGGRLGGILIRSGVIGEEQLLSFLSQQYGVAPVDVKNVQIDPTILKLIPVDLVKKYMVLPIKRTGTILHIAMADPSDVFAIDDIKFMSGYNVEPLIATDSTLVDAINKHYGGGTGTAAMEKRTKIETKDYVLKDDPEEDALANLGENEDVVSVEDFDAVVGAALGTVEMVETAEEGIIKEVDAPIITLVNGILVNAINVGASDIHIEPFEAKFCVRLRIDGVMKTTMHLPLKIKNAVVSRLKIMSKLNIAERRLPQDGRMKLKLGKKKEVDFRVSSVPCLFGEKLVLRILDKGNLTLDLKQLGFDGEDLVNFTNALNTPYGMILVTGPTGSGKTTTLYSALKLILSDEINIMTAEDPIEYTLSGINQVQMKEEIGLTFSNVLRSFLRQDPDVVMVGEMRDFETAEIAVRAALTGHLVLSTLHTNDAPSTVNRLINMGLEPFLVTSSVIMIIAQRLARKICAGCKQPDSIDPDILIKAGFKKEDINGTVFYKGKGCIACNQTGYKGRIALYEVMPIKDQMREIILKGASADEIKRKAISLGMETLRTNGFKKMKQGVTTYEEIIYNTMSD